MRIAVITPYFKEDISVIKKCHDSVVNQTHKNITHIIVSDGYPKDEIDAWNCKHVKIPPCGDYGDTPRGIGALIATSLGFDGICFVDADCWYDPDHIEQMIKTQEDSSALVVTAARNLYREDGSFLIEDSESDGKNFNDTNCYLITRPAFPYLHMWLFKTKSQSTQGDRILWSYISNSKIPIARSTRQSVNYTTTFANHYIAAGESPPPSSKIIVTINDVTKNMQYSEFQNLVKSIERQKKRREIIAEHLSQPCTVDMPPPNIKMFQIYFKQEQLPVLDADFVPFDNTSNEKPNLREWFSWNKIHDSGLVENIDYWGAVSPKFKEKTLIPGNKFLEFVVKNPGYDVYYACPSWIYNDMSHFNVWVDGDKHHPGLSNLANEIMNKLGYRVDVTQIQMDTFFFCNFFLANKKFWNEYMLFIDSIFQLCNNDSTLYSKVFTPGTSNYFQDPTTSMFSFLIERFTPTFVLLKKFKALSFASSIKME